MLDIEKLSTDPELSAEGAWVNYLMGSRLKVARFNNKEAENLRTMLAVESAEILQAGGEAAEAKAEEIENTVLARHILKDWEGITVGGDEEEYTEETGLRFLTDPRFADFRADLIRIAQNRENFREKSVAETVEAVKSKADS